MGTQIAELVAILDKLIIEGDRLRDTISVDRRREVREFLGEVQAKTIEEEVGDQAGYTTWRARCMTALRGYSSVSPAHAEAIASCTQSFNIRKHVVVACTSWLRAYRADLLDGQLKELFARIREEVFEEVISELEALGTTPHRHALLAVFLGVALERAVKDACRRIAPPGAGFDELRKFDLLVTDLKQASRISETEAKFYRAWYSSRSEAAHGKPVDSSQVEIMAQGVRVALQKLATI